MLKVTHSIPSYIFESELIQSSGIAILDGYVRMDHYNQHTKGLQEFIEGKINAGYEIVHIDTRPTYYPHPASPLAAQTLCLASFILLKKLKQA